MYDTLVITHPLTEDEAARAKVCAFERIGSTETPIKYEVWHPEYDMKDTLQTNAKSTFGKKLITVQEIRDWGNKHVRK